MKILIVDDDKNMTRTLKDILVFSGFEADETFNGKDALCKIAASNYDCILSDVKMPEMDGMALHQRIKSIQPSLPVVLMTAHTPQEVLKQGLTEGVAKIFHKPMDMDLVIAFLHTLETVL
ncbi:MAG: response regulator [Spirochaetia bacterium]|nr:response regulator [Spirochaetia bacterium]